MDPERLVTLPLFPRICDDSNFVTTRCVASAKRPCRADGGHIGLGQQDERGALVAALRRNFRHAGPLVGLRDPLRRSVVKTEVDKPRGSSCVTTRGGVWKRNLLTESSVS